MGSFWGSTLPYGNAYITSQHGDLVQLWPVPCGEAGVPAVAATAWTAMSDPSVGVWLGLSFLGFHMDHDKQ